MRILLTVHRFLPKHSLGTERLAFDIGRELQNRGHEVYVLTTDDTGPHLPHNSAWDYTYQGLWVRVVGVRLEQTPDPLRYEYDNPDMAEHMRGYMREVRPDLVHAMHLGLLSGSIVAVAKEFGVPIAFTATDFWSLCRVIHLKRADTGQLCTGPNRVGSNCLRCYAARSGGGSPQTKQEYLKQSDAKLAAYIRLSHGRVARSAGRLYRTRKVTDRIRFLKEVVNSVDAIVAPTKLMRDLMIRNGINPRLIRLSPYGIETSHISGAPRSPVRPPGLRVGYIGSLMPHKGVDVLIKAFRDLPRLLTKAELKIYGDAGRNPSHARYLEGLAKGDARISFLGSFDNEQIGWVLSEIDVLAVPSVWYENAPLVVPAAFVSGTPVVATDVGGLAEAIEHDRNGLLFQRGDARDLHTKLLRFATEPDLIERLRQGIDPGRTADESVDDLELLYGELLGSSGAASPSG